MREIIEEYLRVLSSLKAYLEELQRCGYIELVDTTKEKVVDLDRLEERAKRTKGVIAVPDIPLLFGASETYNLARLKEEVFSCRKCELHKSRTKAVFGAGDENATLMLIGEAPGEEEDLQGEPFVGKAGQLLNRILAAIELSRREVYITNVLKCRPPKNRDPLPNEIEACKPFLMKQIELIKPKLICALGRYAAHTLFKTKASLRNLRGRFHSFRGIKVLVTYHPASILRNSKLKRPTWEDMKMLKAEYDRILKGEG